MPTLRDSARRSLLRPFPPRPVQEQNNARQYITAKNAAVAINNQVSAAEGFLKKDHVEIDGWRGATRAVETDQFIRDRWTEKGIIS